MRKYRIKVSIFGVLLIALMLYASMTVSADDIWIDTYGETEITRSSILSAVVYPWTFGDLDIIGGEYLQINYTVSWLDDRNYPSPTATHYYNITAFYSGTSTTDYDEHEEFTWGATFGDYPLDVSFPSVQPGEHVDITLLAKVTIGVYSAQDYNKTTINLI